MEDKEIETLDEEVKETKEVTPKKKGNGGLVAVIVILLLICGGMGAFIFANKDNLFQNKTEEKEKKETKKEEKEVKDEVLDVDSAEVTSLYEKITRANRHYCGFYELFKDKKMTSDDLSVEEKGQVMLASLIDGNTKEGATYTKTEVENKYREIFGKDVKIEHTSIKSCPSFDYDSSTEKYTVGVPACGGTCGPYATNGKIVKAIKTSDNLVMDVRVVFAKNDNYYVDSNYTQLIEISKDEHDMPQEQIDVNKGTLYKVTFKLEDGNYVFVSSEPVK